MGVDIQFSQSYHWLNSWILANIIQLATQDFYDRFVDYHMDPGRRLYDQTVMATRCGMANIAEGTALHSTSVETEMRLLDVARASFDELQGDLSNFLLRKKAEVWPNAVHLRNFKDEKATMAFVRYIKYKQTNDTSHGHKSYYS